ncbi:uncharacterized protein F53A9.9-like isoform X2 [Melospiza melodia melodia]|uniref:uncharacterized protein F53A9.9-like isoform X2 n=1 Tax=Melospiza melodia melodia TaxID=1914991 RepID=UPI002FD09E56
MPRTGIPSAADVASSGSSSTAWRPLRMCDPNQGYPGPGTGPYPGGVAVCPAPPVQHPHGHPPSGHHPHGHQEHHKKHDKKHHKKHDKKKHDKHHEGKPSGSSSSSSDSD